MINWILEGHDHVVYVVNYRDGLECDACDRSYGDAYSCGHCKFTVHKKCTFMFNRKKTVFEHPSHVGHRLKFLTSGAPEHTDPKCHFCGKHTKRFLYHCSTCELNLDIDCMVDALCGQAHLNFPWHHHPLLLMVDYDCSMECEVCGFSCRTSCYFCPRCRLMVHEKCISLIDLPEIIHPSHAKHSLKLLTEGAPTYTDPECHICGKDTGRFIYHCDICKLNLDLKCAVENPPSIALSKLKVHLHTITLLPRLISFVCDACGTKGDRAPYLCHQCDLIIHQKCAQLPRVIHVNHHDHRVSYKYPLGLKELRCGVCWEEIDWSYGAYSCSIFPNYAIHSRCAIRRDVWDQRELDEVRDNVEDIEPFKMNEDNTITHFAHEHNLMSLNKDSEESSLCGACVRPIGSNTFYKCSESDCSFILHESCANLPKKKRHFLSPHPLALHLHGKDKDGYGYCRACRQPFCEGFMYTTYNQNYSFDLLCSSITVPFIHGSHDHHLLYLDVPYGDVKTCQNCGMDKNHDHVVIVGDIKYAKGGNMTDDLELLANNSSSRPFCNTCRCRCPGPFILKDLSKDREFLIQDGYDVLLYCSYYCFMNRGSKCSLYNCDHICPPWAPET